MKRGGQGSGGKKTRGGSPLQRRSFHRPEKTRILIVCEGRETEPNYFRGLRGEETVRQNFSVVVLKGKGGSSLAVVQQAIAGKEKATVRGEEFDEIWCVFDVEQAGQREQVVKARTLADQKGILLAVSNPSFECWLLAHFVRTKKSFANCDEVVKELNKHWRRAVGCDYEKNDERLYATPGGTNPGSNRQRQKSEGAGLGFVIRNPRLQFRHRRVPARRTVAGSG